MRAVLTIHGIGVLGGRGPWQGPIGRVLAPHFRCITIKYSHYRWLGFFSAVLEPRVFLLGLTILFIARRWHGIPQLWAWIVGLLVISCIAAQVRHRMALSHLLTESSHRLPLGIRPHVIAHSMGTRLIGTALKEYPQVRFGSVVLTGCVLPTNYPWRDVRRTNSRAFERVRNEVASKDLVPLLAHVGHRLGILRGYGNAGRVGFDAVPNWVHNMGSPNTVCGQCTAAPPPAPIHNVTSAHGTHSSAFATPEFAAYYWLPFFWNIDPVEYSDFLELCLDANEHYESRNWSQLRVAEEELLHSEWQWARGTTLEAHIQLHVSIHPRGRAIATSVIALVLQKMYVDIAAATEAYRDRGEDWQRKVAALHPVVAMIGAIDVVLG